ncbi:hypothetical protein PR048_019828 [Dryococelus australis]|uniref:DDE Tnp4 domain-containing protein n=1 Tax=Dryococelus australis TaxID=614101 RepID=A0ABQ9H4N9_9NEOP|nr:hypothetical protein PR048_019828 [Dryococelus australis]
MVKSYIQKQNTAFRVSASPEEVNRNSMVFDYRMIIHQISIQRKNITIANFSHCVGAINCTHIAIQKPAECEWLYYNHNKFFCILSLVIVNANYRFTYIHVGSNGCIRDFTISERITFYEKLLNRELQITPLPPAALLTDTAMFVLYVIVGDSAFSLNQHLMKPYPLKSITHCMYILNYRSVSKNAFGILASRFRVFHSMISIRVHNINKIILACCALRTYLLTWNASYCHDKALDQEDVKLVEVCTGQWREQKMVPL